MALKIGILIFDDAEELDFVGPWEVFTMANEMARRTGKPVPHEVFLIAEQDRPVRCAKGMRVLPDTTTAECRALDILLIPGGQGTRREAANRALLDWIADVAKDAKWVTSVCTGALLSDGRRPGKGEAGHDALGLCRDIARPVTKPPRFSQIIATCATATC